MNEHSCSVKFIELMMSAGEEDLAEAATDILFLLNHLGLKESARAQAVEYILASLKAAKEVHLLMNHP